MSIGVRGVVKRFGAFTAVDGVTLEVQPGELVALLGPSGSGKTTLLRLIAGLEVPDEGTVHLGGQDATARPAAARRVGFVFQHYALFRHLTVFENVAFGLRVRPRATRPAEPELRARVGRLLALVQLEALADRLPSGLSGGQRQRVALARALAVEPQVLLLDEPFGALDARVRKELRRFLRRLHDDLGVTSLFVTHDQEEALEAADRVVVMDRGRIEQVGTPVEIYAHPANAFVCDFLGDVNLFHGRIHDGRVEVEGMRFDAPPGGGDRASLYVRPHQLHLAHEAGGEREFRARVVRVNAAGPTVKVDLVAEWGDPVRVELSQERQRELGLCEGAAVFVSPTDARVFPV